MPDDAPALREAFTRPRLFEPCNAECCRDENGFLTDTAREMVLAEFDQDFPGTGR
jgi:hypothetical protein